VVVARPGTPGDDALERFLYAPGIRWDGPLDPQALAALGPAAAIDALGLLRDTTFPVVRPSPALGPAQAWAASGARSLTGTPRSGGVDAPGDVATYTEGAALAFEALAAATGHPVELDGAALLGERAALSGLARRGRRSAGGSCRLFPSSDGWVAVSLSRPTDTGLVEAWLGRRLGREALWRAVVGHVASLSSSEAVGTAQLLGLPVSAAVDPQHTDEQLEARATACVPWRIDDRSFAPALGRAIHETDALGAARALSRTRALVVDLSALWGGPLAGSLLAAAGCEVVKVEDPSRPDPTRVGAPAFFDLLNGAKRSAALSVASDAFAALVGAADLVIEASRPRALEQLGIGPGPGQAWVAITGYGRSGPWREWAALGDDAAVAGGLFVDRASRSPWFCADAAADPLTGLHAALAGLAALHAPGACTVDVAMREVVRHTLGPARPSGPVGEAAPPRARPIPRSAPALGADTDAVLAAL
jgi:CoA-transferase family III